MDLDIQRLKVPLGIAEVIYRGPLHSAQNIVKKDPGRARHNSLVTAGTNFTKPGAQNKIDLCSVLRCRLRLSKDGLLLLIPGQRRQKSAANLSPVSPNPQANVSSSKCFVKRTCVVPYLSAVGALSLPCAGRGRPRHGRHGDGGRGRCGARVGGR